MGVLHSIGQIAVVVQDPARAKEFYRDVLGLSLLFEAGELSFFDCGGVRLMLSRSEQKDGQYSSIVYYNTDDIQATAGVLEARGVTLESAPHMIAKMPDHELWMAFLRDTEGNLPGLMSEVR